MAIAEKVKELFTGEDAQRNTRAAIIFGVLLVGIIGVNIYVFQPFSSSETDLTAPKSPEDVAVRCATAYFRQQLGENGNVNFAEQPTTEPKDGGFLVRGPLAWNYMISPTNTVNETSPAEVTIKLEGGRFQATGARISGGTKFPKTNRTLSDATLPKP